MHGEAVSRFEHARLFLTGVDGKVTETRFTSRLFQASLQLSAAGVYRVEVMGYGASGPVVLANVPVYVGVPEPEPARAAGAGAAPVVVDAEARLLALLNRARADAQLAALEPDPELRAVALGHSEEMAATHFLQPRLADHRRHPGLGPARPAWAFRWRVKIWPRRPRRRRPIRASWTARGTGPTC